MAFENLQDQLREQLTALVSKIEESPTFNTLREKYETLTPTAQKGIIAGTLAVVLLVIVSIPYSYFDTASTQIEEYEGHRDLLRGLLRASRLASEVSSAPSFASIESIKTRITNEVANKSLQPEQMGGVNDLPDSVMGGNLAPAPITQAGIGLSLKKLNLSQVIDMAFSLQNMHPAVKLSGIEITAGTTDPHYFDVLYKIAVFGQEGGGGTADINNESDATGGTDAPEGEEQSE